MAAQRDNVINVSTVNSVDVKYLLFDNIAHKIACTKDLLSLVWQTEPASEISGSLKNLKPEKIGLLVKFNRYIHVLVIPKFGQAQ